LHSPFKVKTLNQLVCHLLGNACEDESYAEKIIQTAKEQNTELFKFIISEFNLSSLSIYQKAAAFCDLAFSEIVPRDISIKLDLMRLDMLATINCFEATLFDKEILFTSADAISLLSLSNQVTKNPRFYVCIVPPYALQDALVSHFSDDMMSESRQRLARRWPYASAHIDLTYRARILFLVAAVAIISLVTFAPISMTLFLLPLLVLLFLLPAWLRLSAVLEKPDYKETAKQNLLSDKDLPIYSVLIPLRDEAHMVRQLASAMCSLNYPAHKLDVKFIVESASPSTIKAVREILDDPRFELIIVPKSAPHTKPKALDYALPLVRGKHLVIYDAEDIAHPDQLRKAATRFASDFSIDCIQAELEIENASENWLTACFSAEYSGLFGIMLPALSNWKFPMPLGGTSNHFRTRSLLEVGGWDAFNVTEDADLGLRLSRLRYKTGVLKSTTLEEAPISLGAWMGQRTRWMKGWMQTYIVHNSYPKQFLKDIGWRNFLAFQIYVGSLVISAPLHTIFFIVLIVRFIYAGNIGFVDDDIWLVAHLFFIIAGYSSTALHSAIGLIRLKKYKLLWIIPTLPIYWGLVGIASIIAAYELMVKPYFWSKTKHGVSKRKRMK